MSLFLLDFPPARRADIYWIGLSAVSCRDARFHDFGANSRLQDRFADLSA